MNRTADIEIANFATRFELEIESIFTFPGLTVASLKGSTTGIFKAESRDRNDAIASVFAASRMSTSVARAIMARYNFTNRLIDIIVEKIDALKLSQIKTTQGLEYYSCARCGHNETPGTIMKPDCPECGERMVIRKTTEAT